MRSASRTSMAPFSLRFTSDSSVRSSSPMGGSSSSTRRTQSFARPKAMCAQACAGRASRPGTPRLRWAASSRRTAGRASASAPHCARRAALGGVEALQIGLHKIPVLFHHSSSTSNS